MFGVFAALFILWGLLTAVSVPFIICLCIVSRCDVVMVAPEAPEWRRDPII